MDINSLNSYVDAVIGTLKFAGKTKGNGNVNTSGGELEKDFITYEKNPNSQNLSAYQAALSTFAHYVNTETSDRSHIYTRGTRSAMQSLSQAGNSIPSNVEVKTPYSTLQINTSGATSQSQVAGTIDGYSDVMNKYGSLMSPSQKGQADTFTFGDTSSAHAYAYTLEGTGKTVIGSTMPGGGWAGVAGHETMWDIESPDYGKAVSSTFSGGLNTGTTNWVLQEDAENYLVRQAVPGDPDPLSSGEAEIDKDIKSGKFTLDDLAKAFVSGDQASINKVFSAFPHGRVPSTTNTTPESSIFSAMQSMESQATGTATNGSPPGSTSAGTPF
jgi:hypothetical protein